MNEREELTSNMIAAAAALSLKPRHQLTMCLEGSL